MFCNISALKDWLVRNIASHTRRKIKRLTSIQNQTFITIPSSAGHKPPPNGGLPVLSLSALNVHYRLFLVHLLSLILTICPAPISCFAIYQLFHVFLHHWLSGLYPAQIVLRCVTCNFQANGLPIYNFSIICLWFTKNEKMKANWEWRCCTAR